MGMRTTIDRAGRVVIPKPLRDELGMGVGEVELSRDGNGVRIEPVAGEGTVTKDDRLVIDEDMFIDDDAVRDLRFRDQR